MYPDLANAHGALLYPSFLGPLVGEDEDLQAAAALFQADRIHPNAEGVKKIVAAIGPTVLELLAEPKASAQAVQ